MEPKTWTADDAEAAVVDALEERDFGAAIHWLRVLNALDAHRASELYDSMLVGIDLARSAGVAAAVDRVVQMIGADV